MKKISIIMCTVFLSLGIISCTPQALQEEAITPQACCGDDFNPPPPPPPPPPTGD